jgi:hypothetical protein
MHVQYNKRFGGIKIASVIAGKKHNLVNKNRYGDVYVANMTGIYGDDYILSLKGIYGTVFTSTIEGMDTGVYVASTQLRHSCFVSNNIIARDANFHI